MRTNEERAGLIHKRTAEIKRERQKEKQRALDMICIAACLILIVGIGSSMPGLAADIPGVHGAEVIPNCVDRDNRYDVLIRLDMDREALPLYDVSAMHHRWKDEFTPLLEKKAIFDHES